MQVNVTYMEHNMGLLKLWNKQKIEQKMGLRKIALKWEFLGHVFGRQGMLCFLIDFWVWDSEFSPNLGFMSFYI